jgi:hypothetical protein
LTSGQLSVFSMTSCALLAERGEPLLHVVYLRDGGLGHRGRGVRVARGAVGGLGELAVVLGFEELAVEPGKALDDRVLARVERENLVALGVVAQALAVRSYLRLELGDARL